MRTIILIILLSVSVLSFSQIKEEKRIALVIGNSYYGSLKTPHNDARKIAYLLDSLNFNVILKLDQDSSKLQGVIDTFCLELKKYDVALLFFSGMGFLFQDNYKYVISNCSRDNLFNNEFRLKDQSFKIDDMMHKIRNSGCRLTIGMFDICLNHIAFERHRGIVEKPAQGEVCIYSTTPGNTALDGEVHSPFVEAIISSMNRPKMDLYHFIDYISEYVENKTKGRQKVYYEGSLHGTFQF